MLEKMDALYKYMVQKNRANENGNEYETYMKGYFEKSFFVVCSLDMETSENCENVNTNTPVNNKYAHVIS